MNANERKSEETISVYSRVFAVNSGKKGTVNEQKRQKIYPFHPVCVSTFSEYQLNVLDQHV